MTRYFLFLLLVLWQLPQVLLGIAVVLVSFLMTFFLKGKTEFSQKDSIFYFTFTRSFSSFGVSLGSFIILSYKIGPQNIELAITKRHEYGHSIQSRILGPLYLFLVGLPSVYHNLRSRFDPGHALNYYRFYPEAWADKLGKVAKEERGYQGV
jgi:hypothetical protein